MATYDPKVTPWALDAAAYPQTASAERRANFLLRYAILAPSSHNTQPWLFNVREFEIRIYADTSRWLKVADPEQRELYISLGCALENLLVAAEYFGFGHEVVLCGPDDHDGPAAIVNLIPGGGASGWRAPEMLDAILARTTNYRSYESRAIPEETVQRLRGCCHEDGVGLALVDDPQLRREVHELVVHADARLFADPAWREELGHWIGRGAFGSPWLMAKLGQLAVTYLNTGRSTARRDAEVLMSAPVFGVLGATMDDRASRIRVGQVFERIYLTATLHRLGLQPMSQIVEVPELRSVLPVLLPEAGPYAMQPFRIGYAEPDKERTPRRPLEEVLL